MNTQRHARDSSVTRSFMKRQRTYGKLTAITVAKQLYEVSSSMARDRSACARRSMASRARGRGIDAARALRRGSQDSSARARLRRSSATAAEGAASRIDARHAGHGTAARRRCGIRLPRVAAADSGRRPNGRADQAIARGRARIGCRPCCRGGVTARIRRGARRFGERSVTINRSTQRSEGAWSWPYGGRNGTSSISSAPRLATC